MPQPTHHATGTRHTDVVKAKPLWVVTNQIYSTVYTPGLDPYGVWTVYYTTRSGVQGQVAITEDQYTAETVAAVVEPLAQELEDIAALKAK